MAAPRFSRPTVCIFREAHTLLEDLTDPTLAGTPKVVFADLLIELLRITDDLGMRKLPHAAAEDLLEPIMRRHERIDGLDFESTG